MKQAYENYNLMAWAVIDHMVANDYGGNKQALIDEVGDLNDYASRIAYVLENHTDVRLDDTEMIFVTSQYELNS